MEMQTGALYELKIPKRSLIFLGPQRCGKITAMLASLWHVSKYGKIVIVCNHADFSRNWMDEFRINGNLKNVIHMPLMCKDVPERLREHGVTIKDISTVAILESSVFQSVGMVKVWKRPSPSFVEFMQRMSEDTAMEPKVYIKAHLQGHENDVAVG
ncbi:MAG: hypothetical protein WC052_06045 [Patescibacteria group bacterium]